jgi:hypothetical protein
MSTSIRMNPVTEVEYVDYAACGSLSDTLAGIFGVFPIRLTRENLDTLRALAHGFEQGHSPDAKNPFRQIYNYVNKHGEVILETEH